MAAESTALNVSLVVVDNRQNETGFRAAIDVPVLGAFSALQVFEIFRSKDAEYTFLKFAGVRRGELVASALEAKDLLLKNGDQIIAQEVDSIQLPVVVSRIEKRTWKRGQTLESLVSDLAFDQKDESRRQQLRFATYADGDTTARWSQSKPPVPVVLAVLPEFTPGDRVLPLLADQWFMMPGKQKVFVVRPVSDDEREYILTVVSLDEGLDTLSDLAQKLYPGMEWRRDSVVFYLDRNMRRALVLDDRLSTLDVAAIYVKLALDPVPGQAFTIFVKPLRDKNRFVLQVSRDLTIARVKFLLQDKTGWPLNAIRLTSGLGSEYQDSETLENLNIVDGSELKLLYKL